MKKSLQLVGLISLFGSIHTTELQLQLSVGDQAAINAMDDGQDARNRPTNGIFTNPMPQPRPDAEMHLVTPAFQIPIHPEDASVGSNPTYDIKSSGRYYLTNDFKISASTTGGSLLKISAHNVSLNLNAKVVVPSPTASDTTLTGILVANGKNNVQIMNGTIQCVPAYGNGRVQTGINLGDTTTSYSAKLQDIFVNQATVTGITGSVRNNLSLERVAVNNMSGTAAVTGLSLTTCKNVNILDCEFNRNTTSSGNCKGIVLSGCEDGLIQNVTASGNTTTHNNSSSVVMGISLASSCKNLTFKNCSSTDNIASFVGNGFNTFGFSISASPLNHFINCIGNGNGGSSGRNTAVGFYVIGASNNCTFTNCEASKNYSTNAGTAATGYGFYIGDSAIYNMTLNNCVANYNQAAGTSSADTAGIYLTTVHNSHLNNCVCNKNSSILGVGYGIFQNGCNNNSFNNCSAIGNVSSATDYVAVGFYSTGGTANRFVNCKANAQNMAGSTTTLSNGNGGCGFQLFGETRTQLINCQAIGNQTTNGSTSIAYGIFLGGSCANCTVKDCYVAYNTAGASGLAFGIYDNTTSSPTTTLFLSNISAGHGQCLTGAQLNASMQWNSNSRPTVSQNFFFKHDGTGDNPQNVIHEVPKWNLASLSTSVKMWENVSIY